MFQTNLSYYSGFSSDDLPIAFTQNKTFNSDNHYLENDTFNFFVFLGFKRCGSLAVGQTDDRVTSFRKSRLSATYLRFCIMIRINTLSCTELQLFQNGRREFCNLLRPLI